MILLVWAACLATTMLNVSSVSAVGRLGRDDILLHKARWLASDQLDDSEQPAVSSVAGTVVNEAVASDAAPSSGTGVPVVAIAICSLVGGTVIVVAVIIYLVQRRQKRRAVMATVLSDSRMPLPKTRPDWDSTFSDPMASDPLHPSLDTGLSMYSHPGAEPGMAMDEPLCQATLSKHSTYDTVSSFGVFPNRLPNAGRNFVLSLPPAGRVMAEHVNLPMAAPMPLVHDGNDSMLCCPRGGTVDDPWVGKTSGNDGAAASASGSVTSTDDCIISVTGISLDAIRQQLQDAADLSLQDSSAPPPSANNAMAALLAGQAGQPREVLTTGTLTWTRGGCVGSGAYGRVYAGLNQQTGELMAVKVVDLLPAEGRTPANMLQRQSQLRELQQELALYKTLRHRHVVGYIDSHFDPANGGRLSIFLEFVMGGSISAMLQQFGSFTEDVVASYTWQLLLGLQYLHERGIVHRDVKGGNVLVSNLGIVKLADFGASRLADLDASAPDHGITSLRGSVFWMAPEVMQGTGCGRPADIWSLGCTVIEMLTGLHPWPLAKTAAAVMYQVTNNKTGPLLPKGASHLALDFLNHCLRMEPAQRPTASELLWHPFVGGAGMQRLGRSNSARRGRFSARSLNSSEVSALLRTATEAQLSSGDHLAAGLEPASRPLAFGSDSEAAGGEPLDCQLTFGVGGTGTSGEAGLARRARAAGASSAPGEGAAGIRRPAAGAVASKSAPGLCAGRPCAEVELVAAASSPAPSVSVPPGPVPAPVCGPAPRLVPGSSALPGAPHA